MATAYSTEDEIIENYLLKAELPDLEDSHISVRGLSRVLRHRAPEYWSKQDEEEVVGEGTNVALGRLQEMIHGRRHLWYPFLECLRMLHYNLPIINKHLPVERCVLWFVSSSRLAAKVIQCCSQSTTFNDRYSNPFFWPSEQSDTLQSSTHQFLYRYCALFGGTKTTLVLIYPQEYSRTSVEVAVQGALSKWNAECSLIMYTTLGCGCGLQLFDSVLVNSSSDLLQKLPTTNSTLFHNIAKERSLYWQMIWLARLIIDIQGYNETGRTTSFLTDLGWDVSSDQTSLTPSNASLIERNLSHYADRQLMKYIKSTRMWRRDNSSFIGLCPTKVFKAQLRGVTASTQVSSSAPKVVCLSANQLNCSDIEWFYSALPTNCTRIPVNVCCGVNQLSPGITTPQTSNIAAENICNLSIDIILNNK